MSSLSVEPECGGQIFSNVDMKMRVSSVEYIQAVFEMSDVNHFLASVSGVGLKNWTMSGVGKTPLLGPNSNKVTRS